MDSDIWRTIISSNLGAVAAYSMEPPQLLGSMSIVGGSIAHPPAPLRLPIGAYISPDNEVILDAVVHASSSKGRVIIQSLTDPRCPFVKYCKYDYIEYDMSYFDSLLMNVLGIQLRNYAEVE